MNKKISLVVLAVIVAFGIGYIASKNYEDENKNTTKTELKKTSSERKMLDLSGQQLSSLPNSATNRDDITAINLSNNQFVVLDSDISTIKNLEVLNVENNRLESFTPELTKMTNLTEIYANNNRLSILPPEFAIMTWLKVLDLSGNNIPLTEIDELKSTLPNTNITF